MDAVRLNLASGTDIKRGDGWINLDVVAWPMAVSPPDVIWDATKDAIPTPDNSVDEIYAGYLFLHIPPRHHQRLIADIFRTLKPGGRLVVGEVDMALVMPRWLENPGDQRLQELIWGEQGSEHGEQFEAFDRHVWGWTESKLRGFLGRAGFVGIERIQIHVAEVWYELTLACRKP